MNRCYYTKIISITTNILNQEIDEREIARIFIMLGVNVFERNLRHGIYK